jgi:hypothetical protein
VDKSEPRLDRHANEEPSPQEYDEFLAEAKTLSCNSSNNGNGNGSAYHDGQCDWMYQRATHCGSVTVTPHRIYFNA